jgi:hypothetical protein
VCGELNPADNKYYTVKEETDGGITETTTYTPDPDTCECTSETVCSGSYTVEDIYEVSCLRIDNGQYEDRPGFTITYTYTLNDDCTAEETVDDPGPYTFDHAVYSGCDSWIESSVTSPPFLGVNDPTPPAVYSVSPPDEIFVPPLELPDYPDFDFTSLLPGQGISCSAHHTDVLIKDEHDNVVSRGISQRKVKWRGWNHITGTCYYKHWVMALTETVADPDADPPVEASSSTEEADTFTWSGTGNPCIPAPKDPNGTGANRIIAEDTHEIDVPEKGQTVTVYASYYSCLPAYTPDTNDPTKPSGYPCPGCEAEAP